MAKCDLCKKWGKVVYAARLKMTDLYGYGLFKDTTEACLECIKAYHLWYTKRTPITEARRLIRKEAQ